MNILLAFLKEQMFETYRFHKEYHFRWRNALFILININILTLKHWFVW